jgi:hypothetical protein
MLKAARAERAGLEGEKQAPGLTPRALVVALVLTVLAGLWVRQAEIVVLSTQISESVPAIPGLAALVLLLAVNAVLRFVPRVQPFTRAEILVVFLFVTLSSAVMGIGVVQFLFSLMTAPYYLTTDGIDKARPFLPRWLAPHDLLAIKHLYEHAPGGRVPWSLWLGPGLCWLAFFLMLWWTLYCLLALFYRAWADDERLAFPLVALPMEMTDTGERGTPFFRNQLMWGGFALSAVYNLVNIAHAFYPSAPAFGKEIDLSGLFTALPWSEVARDGFSFHIRPELVGLGFLVSTEISLTVWASYLALKLVSVLAAANGSTPGLLPMEQEQGMGAFLVLAGLLTWLARRRLGSALRAAIANRPADGPEGVRYRMLFFGLAGGFLCSFAFMVAAGMAAWVALAYLGVVLAVALVYGRIRAEVGAPLIWLFPFGLQRDVLLYTFGSQPLVSAGPTTLPVLALFTFLARGYYPEMTGYQIEGMEIARRARIQPNRVVFALCLAVGVGFVLGWINHLIPYYRFGAAQLRGGIWGQWVSTAVYRDAVTLPTTPRMPQIPRLLATFTGGALVFMLWLLRLRFAGFWFHPLGYAMTCSYGSLIWGPFLTVWLLKSALLRYGGMRTYRLFVPFFLGLALGHFAVAGILWGLTGGMAGDAVQGYPVFFG